MVENPLAMRLLEGAVGEGGRVLIGVGPDGAIDISIEDPVAAAV